MSEDVPDIILGVEQELFPDDMSRRRQIEEETDKQRLAFGKMVETIIWEMKAAELIRLAGGGWVG